MKLSLPKVFTLLISLVFLFVSCSSNVAKPSPNTKQNEISDSIETQKSDIKVIKVFVLDSKGFSQVNTIPDEIKNLKIGGIIFDKTNLTIISMSSYSSLESATNSIIQKNDVAKFIFDNFVKFENEDGSNAEYIKNSKPEDYILKDDFKFDKSYIAQIKINGKEEFRVLSVYYSDDESLERNIISAWEGVCWDKEISLNITEKFMKLITSNYNSIKKLGKWID